MNDYIPEWRQRLSRSLHLSRSRPDSKYFQLATVCAQSKPHCRTVVFRGFKDNSYHLLVVTDSRSEKVSHINHNSQVELVWYFAKSREQYRFICEGILHLESTASDKIRNALWQTLSDSSRKPFFDIPPGTPLDIRDHELSMSTANNLQPISPHFCVLELQPVAVDYLDLKKKPHNRIFYTFSTSWKPVLLQA